LACLWPKEQVHVPFLKGTWNQTPLLFPFVYHFGQLLESKRMTAISLFTRCDQDQERYGEKGRGRRKEKKATKKEGAQIQ
jgi:hypothetical protein